MNPGTFVRSSTWPVYISLILVDGWVWISRQTIFIGKRSLLRESHWAIEYAELINAIGGYYAYSKELVAVCLSVFDVTKLSVYTRSGLTGIGFTWPPRDEYDIQVGFGDIGNILAYISIGDRIKTSSAWLVLWLISRDYIHRDGKDLIAGEYIQPELVLSPQEAFYSERRSLTWTSLLARNLR